MYIKKIIIIFFVSSVCCGAGLLGMIWYALQHPVLDMTYADLKLSKKPSIVFDVHGREIARFQVDAREFVSITRVPDHVVKAFLAAED